MFKKQKRLHELRENNPFDPEVIAAEKEERIKTMFPKVVEDKIPDTDDEEDPDKKKDMEKLNNAVYAF